jgi:PilZ domain
MASLPAVPTRQHPLRRSRPRYTLRSLAYVKLDNANGGIVRDLTERGIALQAVTPLGVGDQHTLRFDLLSPRVRVEVRGRVVWADASGQAGVLFTDVSSRQTRALRDWILLQMFSAAVISGRDSIFTALEGQMMVSAAARPAILVEPTEVDFDAAARIRWGFLSLTPQSFSLFVDGLVLACAILLFSVSALAVMGGMPPWPLTATLLLTASAIFISTYQLVFSDFLCGATPGKRLAALAAEQPDDQRLEQRFR